MSSQDFKVAAPVSSSSSSSAKPVADVRRQNRGPLRKILSTPNMVLLLICFMYGLTYIDRINVNTSGPALQKDLHLDPSQLGWVFSAFGWAYLCLQISGGWFSDRFGARITLAVCGLVWSLSTIMMGLVGSLGGLLAWRVVLGLGEGATFPTATRALSDWTPPGLRGYVQGITHAFARLGNFITPPLVAWLIKVSSWRESFVALGCASLVWAAVWWFYFRDNPAKHPGVQPQELAALPNYAARMARTREPVPWKRLTRRMAPVTAVYFCYGWTLWLYLTWLPSYFRDTYSLDLKKSAFFAAAVFFAGVVGDIAGGLVSDHLLRRSGNRNRARRDVIVIGFLCSFIFMMPVLIFHNLTLVPICMAVAFFFAEVTIGPFWAIPMDIAPRYSGSASGLMNIGSALAAAVSPLAAGYVIKWTGNYSLPFIGSMGLLLLGAILAYWMKPNEAFAGGDPSSGAAPAR